MKIKKDFCKGFFLISIKLKPKRIEHLQVQGWYILIPFFIALYIQKQLILQTIYVLNYNQEGFQIKSGL